jgi:hypothetical protein
MNRTKRHSTRGGFHVAVTAVDHGILMTTVMSELSPLGLQPYCSGSDDDDDDDRSEWPSVAWLSVIAKLASPVTYWIVKQCVLNKETTFTAHRN